MEGWEIQRTIPLNQFALRQELQDLLLDQVLMIMLDQVAQRQVLPLAQLLGRM